MVEEIILAAIEGIEESLRKQWDRLRHHYPHHHRLRCRVHQVLTVFINNQTFIIMDPLKLNPGTQAPIVPALLNSVTLKPVPGAAFVPKSNSVDNTAVATVDANNNLVYASAGSANLSSTNTWTYTDENTGEQVVVDITTVQPIQMLAAAEAVTQQIGLGAAVPIPAPAAVKS